MKMKVKSQADLKRRALAQGALAEFSGGKFNTGMERMQMERFEPPPPPPPPAPPPPAPEPAPPPVVLAIEPEPSPAVTEQITVTLDMAPVAEAVNRGNERLTEVITESLKQLVVPTNTSQPNKWVFIIKRDTRGFIESVEASPAL
jgi:hypothetical protein